MTYTPEELQKIIAAHGAWLRNEPEGTRADLSHADLSGANLYGADLRALGDMTYIKSLQLSLWPIGYTHDTMQIGCQRHTLAAWWAFTDEQISRMDSQALARWSVWKPILQSIIGASPAKPTGYEAEK